MGWWLFFIFPTRPKDQSVINCLGCAALVWCSPSCLALSILNPTCGRVISFDSLPIFSANTARQNRRRLPASSRRLVITSIIHSVSKWPFLFFFSLLHSPFHIVDYSSSDSNRTAAWAGSCRTPYIVFTCLKHAPLFHLIREVQIKRERKKRKQIKKEKIF